MPYQPQPIDTHGVPLSDEILSLVERLAEHAHEVWALKRMAEGWSHGPHRDDVLKLHPCLIPYGELPESEKHYDRAMATEILRVVIKLGYRIDPPG
jgi:RyR domain